MGKKIIALLGILILCGLASCAKFKGYTSSNLVANPIPLNHEDEHGDYPSLWDKVYITSTYESFAEYKFKLDYAEDFFEENELLIFSVTCCSSDNMKFKEVLLKDGKLYPLYSRRRIGKNEAVTEDFIVLVYCVELSKSDSYQVGKILFEYY